MRWLLEKITKALIKWCIKRNRVFYITGGTNRKTVYLVRYIVWKSKRFGCLYIHRFMRSDADDPHDHPWNFFTYVISGGYNEHYFDRNKPQDDGTNITLYWTECINRRTPGSLAYRRATDIHKVVVDEEIEMFLDEMDDEKLSRTPLTICLMGPRLRQWGFWPNKFKGSNFVDWRKYLGITVGDSRVEGGE